MSEQLPPPAPSARSTAQAPLPTVMPGSGDIATNGLIYLDASMVGAFGLTANDLRSWSDGIQPAISFSLISGMI
jgi:hypothetical protein